jgi:hypothetical protein
VVGLGSVALRNAARFGLDIGMVVLCVDEERVFARICLMGDPESPMWCFGRLANRFRLFVRLSWCCVLRCGWVFRQVFCWG